MDDPFYQLIEEAAVALAAAVKGGERPDFDAVPADPEDEARQIVEAAMAAHPDGPRAYARELVARRQSGELLGQILGRIRFLGCELLTAAGCLVPRRETEILGRAAIEVLQSRAVPGEEPLVCIDLCCGAGNLACAIARHVAGVQVWAADLADRCVELAARNVARCGLESRIVVKQGDLFGAFASLDLHGRVDVVVCNPPYISSSRLQGDRAELLAREPIEAFDGGPYGLSTHQRVIRDALAFLRPGGWLMLECGVGQHRQLELLFKRVGQYDAVRWERDPAGRPRVAIARRA